MRRFEDENAPAQLLNELLSSGGNVSREVNSIYALENNVVGLHGICSGERRCARQELKHENTKRPVVSRNIMAFIKDDLRSNIFRSSTESPCLSSNLGELNILAIIS